jgi:hypothetical protein
MWWLWFLGLRMVICWTPMPQVERVLCTALSLSTTLTLVLLRALGLRLMLSSTGSVVEHVPWVLLGPVLCSAGLLLPTTVTTVTTTVTTTGSVVERVRLRLLGPRSVPRLAVLSQPEPVMCPAGSLMPPTVRGLSQLELVLYPACYSVPSLAVLSQPEPVVCPAGSALPTTVTTGSVVGRVSWVLLARLLGLTSVRSLAVLSQLELWLCPAGSLLPTMVSSCSVVELVSRLVVPRPATILLWWRPSVWKTAVPGALFSM